MSKKYLVGFSLSPVQSFISESRKTSDFYNASRFLSLIVEFIINKMKSLRFEVIFPADNCNSSDPTLSITPNRVLAVFEGENVDKILKEIKKDVEEEIRQYGVKVLNTIFTPKWKKTYAKNIFERQIQNYFSISYTAIPFEKNGYKDTYFNLERTMSSMKLSRLFPQSEEEGIKCSLCGEREVLHLNEFDGSIGKMKLELENTKKNIRPEISFMFREQESLCTIGLLKRLVDKVDSKHFKQSFPSTAEIAMSDILYNKKFSYAISEYKKKIENFLKTNFKVSEFNAELFYRENVNENYIAKNYGMNNKSVNIQNFESAYKEFNQKMRKIHKEYRLNKYYAIVALDGDHMGKWMSGRWVKDDSQLKRIQENISRRLGDFNKSIRDFFENNKKYGELVYAGGDDVLAFANISSLIDVVRKLKEMYPNKFMDNTNKPTCSIGICVAHYKEPLSTVLKCAMEMEHAAKEDGGRNTFAMSIITKSGHRNKIVGNSGEWKWLGEMEFLINNIKDKKISNSFIYKFLEESYYLDLANSNFKDELFRLMYRSILVKGKEKESLMRDIDNRFSPNNYGNKIKDFLTIVAGISKLLKGGEV